MPNPYFRFKQFTIYQDRCAMKVGTDGVLLGAWLEVREAQDILDIGTGTGLIALMLAQRSSARVHAVEIDAEAAGQAGENFQRSPWAERLQVFRKDFRDFVGADVRYDLIVSNPPYFNNSLKAPDPSFGRLRNRRSVARHDHLLNLNELMAGVVPLLKPKGRLGIVYPSQDLIRLEKTGEQFGLRIIRRTNVIPAPGKEAKRVLLELSREKAENKCNDLIIEEFGRHRYSEAFKSLTSEFYLKA